MPPNTSASRLRLQLTESKISNGGIQAIYAIGIVVWIIITMILELWPYSSKTSRLFLALPILLCVGNIVTPIPGSDVILDPTVEQSSILTYILIGSSIISPWLSVIIDRRKKYHVRIIKAFVVMLLLLTLTQYGLFALRYVSDLEVHTTTILNAFALSLLGYTVSEYLHSEYDNPEDRVGISKSSLMRSAQRTNLTTGAQVANLGGR